MIQFNLLPNVKLEYVKARRNKRLTLLFAALSAGAMLAITIILFIGVQIIQKKYYRDLSGDIKVESAKLEGTQDINKILTIQNQLASLPALHDQKPVATRLLGFIKQVTPENASFANLDVDFETQSIKITGSADSLTTVNKFADTLKFTTFTTQSGKEGSAFSSVVLASFGRDTKGSSYSLTFNYDPVIFSNESLVTLTVPPGKITTRSETEKPSPEALFQPLSNPSEGSQ